MDNFMDKLWILRFSLKNDSVSCRIELDWVCVRFTIFHLLIHTYPPFIHTMRSAAMLEKILEKWEEILLYIKEEYEITDVSYKTWLLPLTPYSVDKDILTIIVPDDIFLNYVKKKYELLLKVTVEEITGFPCEIQFILPDQVREKQEPAGKKLIRNTNGTVSQLAIQNANLNPRYTFDTFVVGNNR